MQGRWKNIISLWSGLILACCPVLSIHGSSWQETAYSMAASEMGLLGFYRMEDDLTWRRSDDNRFASYKDLEAPASGEDWWVKTFYRSDVFPADRNISFSQDYSAILIGHESSLIRNKWHGQVYQGAFYTMSTSNAYINPYVGLPEPYGGGSNSLETYGGAVYLRWAGETGDHVEGVFRVSNIQSTMAYTNGDGTSGIYNARVWLPSLGLRYYDTRVSRHRFFWEPQAGVSLGYMKPYTMTSKDTQFEAGNALLVTGRVGIMAGKSYTLQGHNGIAYGRVSMQRNFSGPLEGTAKETATGEKMNVTVGEGHTTWYDMTVGTSLSLGQGNVVWGELTRRFGSNLANVWNVNGGLVIKWGGASRKEKEEFQKKKDDPRSLDLKYNT